MNLADRLREALALEHRDKPVLIEGDPHDPLVGPHAKTTPAAVLMPVVDRPEPTVILTVRATTMKRHPGEIAFPGGRIDPGDRDAVAAALREAAEEIALPPGGVEVVGTTDRYRTITGYEVTPVVGIVPPDLDLTPQPGEVAAIFEAPLDYLLRPEHQLVRTVLWRGRERSYFEIMWEDRRIWGATAAMIVNLSRRLAVIA
ncbi:CoA pyrophosphatase [Sphingosinicella humi]|uniref:CoA pyrophosphatase n=1 Tax=Allosphingosinicella humi TaxID=2068657 RepID=A0A2U2J1H1_9SPHN|nr:CoA pyrophosphatase [Sphingosinicella humi]PWG02195.1 CoA pyrophosphatase [Sphingosinicella humi]